MAFSVVNVLHLVTLLDGPQYQGLLVIHSHVFYMLYNTYNSGSHLFLNIRNPMKLQNKLEPDFTPPKL